VGAGALMVGAAVANRRTIRAGLPDIKDITLAWQAGYVFVGNGTAGATDSVYFTDNSNSQLFTYLTPVAPGDAAIGQTYCTDLIKHFSKKVVHDVNIHFLPRAPSTQNSCTINVGPYRGGNFTPTVTASTAAAPSVAGVLGMEENVTFSSWEYAKLPMKRFIAGGTGPQQNEFTVSASAAEESAPSAASNSLSIPCGFAVTGTNSTSALRATFTHTVVIEMRVTLKDFIGGITPAAVDLPGNSPWRPNQLLRPRALQVPAEEAKEIECIDHPPPSSGWFSASAPPSRPKTARA